MAEQDVIECRPKVSAEEIKSVALRLEQTYHSMKAMHDLCGDLISHCTEETGPTLVVLRELLRSAARDMENCAEILADNRGGFGFFCSDFGSI